jgi:hypothetical protein
MKKLLAAILLFTSFTASAECKVIQHPSTTDWTITIQDLRYIYSLNKRIWSTGVIIRPIIRGWSDPQHYEFVKYYLGVRPERLRSTVEQRINQGAANGPMLALDNADMVSKVARNRGAIGYGGGSLIIPHNGTLRRVKVIGGRL